MFVSFIWGHVDLVSMYDRISVFYSWVFWTLKPSYHVTNTNIELGFYLLRWTVQFLYERDECVVYQGWIELRILLILISEGIYVFYALVFISWLHYYFIAYCKKNCKIYGKIAHLKGFGSRMICLWCVVLCRALQIPASSSFEIENTIDLLFLQFSSVNHNSICTL